MNTMTITLDAASEQALRQLAERSGISLEQYAAQALAAHADRYDEWFVASVRRGFADVAAGRVLSTDASAARDEARRARLANRVG